MMGKIIRSSMIIALIREHKVRLLLKWCWYKYIRRIDIIGFYAGVPIVRSNHLEPDKESTHRILTDLLNELDK